MEIENLEIIVGTYEEFLLGYRVVTQENGECSLVQSFANHSHQASVRSVAAGGKFLASGGADESIILYDMIARKEAGLLMHHRGNVNCLEFSPTGSHLLSGSEDGSIAICRTGSWQLEKLWGAAHKGAAVASLSCHPTGKLMLSVGADATIRTWNLVKGRPAYATSVCKAKEGRTVTQVVWSPNGETYAVVVSNRVEIFTVAAASVVHTIQLDKKVTCVCFVEPELLCVANEEGEAVLHDVETKTDVGHFKAHDGRIRCMAGYGTDWIVTASSAGQIKLWRRKDRGRVREICQTGIGCRVTCLAAITSEPLPADTKDLLVQSSLINASLLGDFPSSSSSSSAAVATKRKRRQGVVTVEDPTATSQNVAEERKLAGSDSEEGVGEAGTPASGKNAKRRKKKKRKTETVTISDEVGDVEEAAVEISTPDEGENVDVKEKTKAKGEKVTRSAHSKQLAKQSRSEPAAREVSRSTEDREEISDGKPMKRSRQKRKVPQVGKSVSTSGVWECE